MLTTLVTLIGISLAWAQTSQVQGEGTVTAEGVSQASASGTARANGAATATGNASGFSVSGGMVNGQNVYAIDFAEKSANSSSTDGSQQAVKDHDATFMTTCAKSGQLIIAGQYMDDGSRTMLVIAKDDAAAQKLADSSPLVTSGYFSYKVRPYKATALGNSSAVRTSRPQARPAP